MSKKVFISYSHKDESFREDLEEHLTMLNRSGVISIWHDRKIVAGCDWKNSIDGNLEASDIIIFLVSPSFLASEYCFDVEVQRAMERNNEGTAKIISIIIRPCDWSGCAFSKFQAVPKNAEPVSLWINKDSAWLDVVGGLKRHIAEFSQVSTTMHSVVTNRSVEVSDAHRAWLDDTEIVLTHRKVDKVKLGDVYVLPDIEFEREYKNKNIDICESDCLFKEKDLYLILGEEQQGKTSLLKKSFLELALNGSLPIYLDSEKISTVDIDKLISSAVSIQYDGLDLEFFKAHSSKVLLLDNIDEIGLNTKFKNVFMENIANEFDWVIATCHSAFSYIASEIPALGRYKSAELLGFGNLKREEVIRKWIALGAEESIEDIDLYSRCDELKSQLNIVIKRNIVPSKPIYILMLMQMFEAYSQQNIELTSYGHCYQQLIYQSFEKAKIHGREYEKYLNVLTEISWKIFLEGGGLSDEQVALFFKEYGNKFLSVNGAEILEKLTSHSILSDKHRKLNFKYPYIYYFFVGKKIAEGFSESNEVKDKVSMLLTDLHREDYANILIFITHHTKDSWVLRNIKEVLSKLFSEYDRASLVKDELSFMGDFMRLIPDLVLEQREIQKERDDQNRRLDGIERKDQDRNKDESENQNGSLDVLANINKTFKGMEIAGQIIRNRHATMTRDTLYELADNGVSTGLRFLDYFIKISNASKLEVINFINDFLSEHPNLTDREIQEHAEGAYLHLTYGVINAVVRKIASSIGSKEACEIYAALEQDKNTPAYTLINQAIELQFKKNLSVDSIQKTLEKLKGNVVCQRILKEMVIQHIYMFPVAYKEKQQLSEILGISVKGQRFMDMKKIGKS